MPSLFLALRLVWEQTVWTWDRGPQMVGFSMIHQGWGAILILILFGGLAWVLAFAFFALRGRSLGGAVSIALLLVYGLSWALVATPYGFWQKLFVDKLASGSHAAQFVNYAAAVGDTDLVKALLSKGVAVDARNREGSTPLHAAAVGGQIEVAEYLLSKGADVNAINRWGDSPLQDAVNGDHGELAKLLAQNGGRAVRGTEEQRKAAAAEIVREQMQELDRRN